MVFQNLMGVLKLLEPMFPFFGPDICLVLLYFFVEDLIFGLEWSLLEFPDNFFSGSVKSDPDRFDFLLCAWPWANLNPQGRALLEFARKILDVAHSLLFKLDVIKISVRHSLHPGPSIFVPKEFQIWVLRAHRLWVSCPFIFQKSIVVFENEFGNCREIFVFCLVQVQILNFFLVGFDCRHFVDQIQLELYIVYLKFLGLVVQRPKICNLIKSIYFVSKI